MKKFFQILNLNLPGTSWDCFLASYQLSPEKRDQHLLAATFLQVAVGIDEVFIQLFLTKQPLFPRLFLTGLVFSKSFTSFITLLWMHSSNSTSFLYWGAQTEHSVWGEDSPVQRTKRQSLLQILCCWTAFPPFCTCPYLCMRLLILIDFADF